MKGNHKEIAAKRTIKMLYEIGYIDDRQKRALEYKLEAGEREVFDKLREYLMTISEQIVR